MALWPRKKKRRTAALIDIGSASVAGAYVELSEGALPALHYSARLPIERKKDEAVEDAMLRTLDELCARLVREGAPELRRGTGSGHADSVLVSVAAPWQDTAVRVEMHQEAKPFLVTRSLLHRLAAKTEPDDPARVGTGESVVSTLLNGYEVGAPFGKRASRAEVVILSSSIDRTVYEGALRTVRRAYHAHDISFVSFAPVAYAVFRDRFPHEKDFLILDVSGEGSDAAFVKNGVLVDVGSVEAGLCALEPDAARVRSRRVTQAEKAWAKQFAALLERFAAGHPLPRTVFLLADDGARDCVTRALDDAAFHALWLSDEPLRLVPVLPGQFASSVQVKDAAVPDIFLAVLALYAAKGIETLAPDPGSLPPGTATAAP